VGARTTEPAAARRLSRRQVRRGVAGIVACLLLVAVGYAGWRAYVGPRETYYLDVARPVATGVSDKLLLDAAHDACHWLGDQPASVSRPSRWQLHPSFDVNGDDDPLVKAERAYLVHSGTRRTERTGCPTWWPP
jgi:hypothetical protein